MPRIDPQQLLNCLSVLLATNGGIKSSKEVNRLVLLMGKFSKKLVSKCIYVQILKSTETELLGQFMADGGWALSHTWLQDGILTRNWPLVQELLELMLLCPVDVQRLKSNSAPKLVKGLSKEGGNEGVRILASKLVEQWLKIVKGETSTLTPVTMPRQDVIVAVLKPEIEDVKQEIDNSDAADDADESEDMVDPLEIPSNHVPQEDIDSKERLAKAKSDGLVFKITVKDGKQVLAKVESSPKKEIDADKSKIKSELNAKNKSEPVAKGKPDAIPKMKIETVDGKKQIKEKIKKDGVGAKEQDKVEAIKKVEKSKNETAKEKSKSDDKERRSSKESAKELADSKEEKEAKDKEKRRDSSSKSSSSKHSSSRSSSHKSSRSSSDSKHKSSSSSSSSRDKSKDSEKDRDRSTKSSSSKSSSKSSSSSSTNNKPKEKRDSLDDKVSQSMKDKDTLSKVIPPLINKLGKIPKKAPTDTDAATESVPAKKSSISIEVKKDTENRPKTVKTFNSQFRSHGLAEEAPPPPSRRGLQRPSSQPTAGASIPATILTKRTSPPPEKKDTVVPEKKLKIDTALATAVEKPGIKLIPAKPKTPVLVESDMFMDAIFASTTTKKDNARKRKRLASQSATETTKPEKVQSPDSKSVAPKFYQDTLDSENKDEDKTEEPKKNDGNAETSKAKDTAESADVEMEEANDSIETKDAESVVENKKPPGPGCGPNGPPGVLTILKRKGPKKQLSWRPQECLEEIHYFELDETERVNVSRSSVDINPQSERFSEREGDAFLISRKMNPDDSMTEQVPWKPLMVVDDVPAHPLGSNSKEKKIQADRESTCLHAIYFTPSMIPDSPAEPDMEQYQITDAAIIPLDDSNGSPEGIKSFVNYPWPEPRGSPQHQPNVFDDQVPFNNFAPNFPFNNQQPGWTPPNVIPPAFNGPHNMLNLNAIPPEPMNNMNNMNMNPMPPFQQNPNFCPPNGLRNNFGNGNFGNDGRMHSGPPQNNNPNWFRPNGPQNNWRPPMGNNNNNNNNRQRPDWNPRNICRSFAKGFCRNGDKCQWLHPGINCPPFN